MLQKEHHLRRILRDMESCIVAFSGGVDSLYLALIAHQELQLKALAVTAESPSYPSRHGGMVWVVVNGKNCRQECIESQERKYSNNAENPSNGCYFVKLELQCGL